MADNIQEQIPSLPFFDNDDQAGGVTVQLVSTHPFKPTTILWVLGKLENKPSKIKAFNNQPKPPAWQNAGGGMEVDEIDRFLNRFADHKMASFAFDDRLTLYDKYVIFCGLREFFDETGYHDVEVFPYFPIYRYDRDDRDDNVSIYDSRLKNGHRAKTIFSHVESFETRDIVEKEEIAKAEWFDMTTPLSRLFFDRINFPLHPFFSHVRRLMITMRRAQKMASFEDAPDYCRRELAGIVDKIHPSWRLIFPIGRGVTGFPERGFRPNRDSWYKLFHKMVAEKIELPSIDMIAHFFQAEILEAKKREERRKEKGEVFAEPDPYLNEYTVGSFGQNHDTVPTEELLRQDEEYAEWFLRKDEESLGLSEDQRVAGCKPVH